MSPNDESYQQNVVVSPSGEVIVLPESVVFDPSKHTRDLELVGRKQDHDHGHGHEHDQSILLRHVSLEFLNPTHDSDTRKSSSVVAIINLVATVCGGGVLSLPLAFRRAGIIPTTLFMIYGVLATNFSLYILISCARRTGGRSYGDVAKAAFGNAAEVGTTCLLALLLLGGLTAYLVLVKDVWTPVLMSLLPVFLKEPLLEEGSILSSIDSSFDQEDRVSKRGGNIILLGILIVGTPLLLKHDLHALRHTSYVGFSSCIVLVLAVVYRAYEALEIDNPRRASLNWYSTELSDLAFAFPIVVLCFLCSYNVLGVHSSLLNPTRQRVKRVLGSSLLLCMVLFYLAGLGGYIYALDETCDNILLNFPLHDPVVLLARAGYCFTLLFGLPLVTLPCREALCAIPAQMRAWRIDAALAKEFKEVDKRRKQGAHLVINGVDFDESVPFLVTEDPEKQHQTMLTYGARHNREHVIGSQDEADNDTEETSIDPGLQMQYSDDEEDQEKQTLENCIHFGSTFAVVGFCYMAAISVPGVGFVYSLCGSSMAILIAFIIPTSCYLKIRKHKRRNLRSVSAWVLLLISVVVAPVCTHQAIANS